MSIHGGNSNIFFIRDGKTLEGAGGNQNYQLGQGNKVSKCVAVRIKFQKKDPGPGIILFKNGLYTACTVVLTTKGLYGCGNGSKGQFGFRPKKCRSRMRVIKFYQGKQVINYFCEGYGLWVVLENQKTFRSGWNFYGSLANGTTNNIYLPEELDRTFLLHEDEEVIDIKAYFHTLMLTDRGNVYSCGNASYGTNGTGRIAANGLEERSKYKTEFTRVKKFEDRVCSIALGHLHSLFLTSSDMSYSCGYGARGRLCHNDEVDRYVPTVISSLKGKAIKKITCGYEYSIFLLKDRRVFASGNNSDSHFMGSSSRRFKKMFLVPARIATSFDVVDVVTTAYSTSFLTSSGDVYSIGGNYFGQCCIGTFNPCIRTLTKSNTRLKMKKKPVLFMQIPSKLTDVCIFAVDWSRI